MEKCSNKKQLNETYTYKCVSTNKKNYARMQITTILSDMWTNNGINGSGNRKKNSPQNKMCSFLRYIHSFPARITSHRRSFRHCSENERRKNCSRDSSVFKEKQRLRKIALLDNANEWRRTMEKKHYSSFQISYGFFHSARNMSYTPQRLFFWLIFSCLYSAMKLPLLNWINFRAKTTHCQVVQPINASVLNQQQLF